MSENVEKIQPAQVNPTPAPAAPAKAPEAVTASAPATSPAEKQDAKVTAAFIAQRKEIRELRQKAALATTATVPPATAPATDPAQQQATTPIASPAPAPKIAARDIEAESVKAIEAMANEKDVASVPGAVMDIIQMVDNDPRLSGLHSIDPTLAFREAKNIWAAKMGIGTSPAKPMSTPTSGGMSTSSDDLDAMVAECEKLKPGTREFNILSTKIRAKLVTIG